MSCRIWSHTWASWYLPKFLFKEGSLTLMNMASLMFLVVPCISMWTMLKQSGLIGCPVELVCWWMGDGALRCSLSLSPNALLVSPIYSSGQLICRHLYLYMTLLFCSLVSLSFGVISNVLMVFEPLKCIVFPSCCMSFKIFTQSMYIWNHLGYVPVFVVAAPIVVVVVVLTVCWTGFIVVVVPMLIVVLKHVRVPMSESCKTAISSLCIPIPWLRNVGCWKLTWPCVLMCCRHCVLLKWSGCCPSVVCHNTSPYFLYTSYTHTPLNPYSLVSVAPS